MYDKLTPPATGSKITVAEGRLVVPNDPIIPFIEGDGTGPDIWRASQRVFDAAVEKAFGGKKKVVWFEVYAGEKSLTVYGENVWLPEDTLTFPGPMLAKPSSAALIALASALPAIAAISLPSVITYEPLGSPTVITRVARFARAADTSAAATSDKPGTGVPFARPRIQLPTLPPQLGLGLGDDPVLVEARDERVRLYDALNAQGGWMRSRLRLKVADDPFNPATERQVLLALGVAGLFVAWRLGSR